MDAPQLLPALFTAAAVYLIYEQAERQSLFRSAPHTETAERLKQDLTRLIQAYYDRYIHPHAYPNYRLVIPSATSYTAGKQVINVAIADRYGSLFDYNTLLRVGAHECAHMLCHVEEELHGAVFAQILARLDELGAELALYDPSQPIADNYERACA